MSIEEGSRTESMAMLKGHQPGSLAGAGECGLGGRCILTHVKMEKKEKAMAARAASVPSFSGLSLETCHWLAR